MHLYSVVIGYRRIRPVFLPVRSGADCAFLSLCLSGYFLRFRRSGLLLGPFATVFIVSLDGWFMVDGDGGREGKSYPAATNWPKFT